MLVNRRLIHNFRNIALVNIDKFGILQNKQQLF